MIGCVKSWKAVQDFRLQYSSWKDRITQEQGTRSDKIEPHKTFFSNLEIFFVSNQHLEHGLDKFCQSGWKIDQGEMVHLKLAREGTLSSAESLLEITVGGKSTCFWWAEQAVQNGKLHVTAHKIHCARKKSRYTI